MVAIRVNCGGGAVAADSAGNAWAADEFVASWSTSTTVSTANAIIGAAAEDQALYNTARISSPIRAGS